MKRSGSGGVLVLVLAILAAIPGCQRQITPEQFAAGIQLQHTLKDHSAALNSLAFSPDRQTLASADFEGNIKFWDPAAGQMKRTYNFGNMPIYCMAYSPDGKFLALAGKSGAVILFDATSPQSNPTSFIAHDSDILALAWMPNQLLATSACAGRAPLGCDQSQTAIWKISQFGKPPAEIKRFPDHAAWLTAMAGSPNGKYLLTGGDDNVINLYQAPQWELANILSGHTGRVTVIAFSRKNSALAISAGLDGAAIFWEIPQGREKLFMKSEGGGFKGMSPSPDGKMIVAGGGGNRIEIWLTSEGKLLKAITGLEADVTALSFNPDGRGFAAAMSDNSILVWSVK